jgi:uncharacterized protein
MSTWPQPTETRGESADMPDPIGAAADPADEIARHRDQILEVARRHGAHNVRVFGSVARGEADAGSDIDFLVDLEPGRSLLDLGGLVMDLADLLRRPVDVVTTRGLRARMRQRVLDEAIPV